MRNEKYQEEALLKQIHTKWAGRQVRFFEEIDSTNLQAKREADAGAAHGLLTIADKQTAGRGRRGRSWSSPPDTNIYFSLLLRPEFSSDKASMLTLVMAYAVASGLEKTVGKDIWQVHLGEKGGIGQISSGIKWPNDLVLGGKKICGILTEMGMEQNRMKYVIIGCGINVGAQEFPLELADKATSLENELNRKTERAELVGNIAEAFEEAYEVFAAEGSLKSIQERYNRLLVNRDREVCVLDPAGEYRGTAKGINDTGELLVERSDGTVQKVYAGEVSVRGIYGYV